MSRMIDDEETLKDNGLIEIDGCNVAECEFIDEWEHCAICREMIDGHCLVVEDIECKTYSDCYFKQLQRAKAELEQYKKSKQASYEVMQVEWNNAVNELRDVKAENNELRMHITAFTDFRAKDFDLIEKLKAENEKLKAELDNYKRID